MGELERKLRDLHIDELSIATILQITRDFKVVSRAVAGLVVPLAT